MKLLLHPARVVALVFLLVILLGSALLMLPIAHAEGMTAPWVTALFTAVSAVCVTGLVVVDTGTYWSTFGQSVILLLFQLGGFGMMTVATLLGLMVNSSFRLRTKMVAQFESRSLGLGDIASVARLVLVVTFVLELILTLLLTFRLRLAYDLPWADAAWNGLFHAVSAFNNAGFSIHPDSLMRYATDAWILLPMMTAIVIGGIGFPVL
ncbi:TrkH family potassium uptake protein, partial [Pseudomonas sp. CrR25]|nr:TrkH family potassium uptake protein [Pseudomonas sp. CrR25]